MAGKNIQINLQFNANVQNAKAQLQGLQTQLNSLINNSASGSLGITPQIQAATRSAMDLKIALNNATNVNTGKLNLNKLQSELWRTGQTIDSIKTSMVSLGPAGVKAFSSFTSAVAQADTKLFSLQGGMRKLANTFMNTVRWQLTSQAIMAVTSTISETINYAKELDTSLNNIRIVTGKSADQMATFAKQANNAAKALSTSTTKYTDASLIYYQQGLNDRAVKERTDVTVKLANVVGENAQTVSQWMTAIWNNFDDGSESLEYYADVLAKLGATTASSASEIAGGLEKFAAVADTIGLSYEYAASMLATITAETRQSEDVVGTALKTILSRMEQLKLGDTLDDGTTLGQYSLALQAVGVNIKHASGELKDMDAILQETGTRWDTLARDQQIALAQSVAGIRQYTQFMALMDNWNVMENNLETTEQANGALQEQQRIYEESTRAAEERMKVAGEALKSTLLGGDDLNKFYNFGAGTLEVINELLEAFGGLPTILLAVAAALTKIYQPQVATFMSKMGIAIKDTWTTVSHPVKAIKGENLSTAQQLRMKTVDEGLALAKSDAPYGTATVLEAEADAQKKLIAMENKLSAEAKQRAEWELQILQSKKDQILQSAEEAQIQEELAAKAGSRLEKKYGNDTRVALTNQAIAQGQVQSHLNIAKDTAQQAQQTYGTKINTEKRQQIGEALSQELNKVKSSSQDLGTSLDNIGFDKLELEVEKFVNNGTSNLEKIIKKIETVQQLLSSGKGADPVIADEVNKQMATIRQNSQDGQANVTAIDNLQKIDNPDANSKKWTKNRAEKALGEIDKNLGNIKEDKLTSKAAKDKIAQWKRESAEIKRLGKNHKDYSARVAALTRDIKKHTDVQNKNNKTLRTSYNANKKMIKTQKDLDKTQENVTKDMKKQQTVLTESAEATETSETNVNKLKNSYDDFGKTLSVSNVKFTSWSNFLASGLGSITSYMMGLNMLSSAFEQIGSSIAKGEGGFTNWISNISSVLMGIGMLLPAMMSMKANIQALTQQKLLENIATGVGVTLTGADTEAKKKNLRATLEAKAAAGDLAAAKALEALGHAGAIVAQSWGAAIGIALMAVGLIAPIIGGIGGFSAGKTEQKQEDVSKGTESLEAINENQELASSVTDLTDEYNALRNAGESTADVLGEMKDKIPELIDSYKELAKTMGTHIDTSELEKAYEVFLKTGDTKLLEKAQEKIDKEVKEKEKSTATSTANTARDLVMGAARSGDGEKNGNQFQVGIGDSDLSDSDREVTEKILNDKLGKYWNEGDSEIQFDLTNNAEVIDAYNAMLATRDELVKQGYTDDNNDFLREINRELTEMSETMPDLINAQQQLFDIEKEEALLKETQFNKDVGLQQVNSVAQYIAVKDSLIAKLKEEKQWTDAQAEAYLKASNAYGGFAEAADFFDSNGLGADLNASKEEVNKIKEWFAGLSEDERTLAMSIDYTVVGSEEEARAALEEARKKAEEARILQEAEALKVDAAVFNTYAESLASVNKGLNKNSNLTKQIALNNLKISKGLETLVKSWDETYNIIQKGNKASFEYAEAIGKVKKAFEEMYGIQPSTEYIEKYSKEINNLVNGNLDSLHQLQDALAEDYIMNMEFRSSDDWRGTIQDAQTQLRGLLDDIDTSVEVGKESTLSSDFLNSVQSMLDAGVIAEDQLETLFRAKGYELNITGWKKMPGPEKTLTRKVFRSDGTEYSETIKESEEISVPIINGQTDGLEVSGTPSVATVTKSTDKRVIDTSSVEEKADKKQDRLDSLKYEKDRYHEINEIISDTKRELDKLGKAKDRAFGPAKLALMDQEIQKQKDLIKNNEKLLKEAQEYAEQDKANLIANTASHLNINFDEYGRIANYEELQQDYINRLKNAAGNEKLYDDISEEYDAFKDAAKQYEESLNKVEEQAETLNSDMDDLYEKNLAKLEYKVQIKVDVADDDRAYIDFLMQKVEDDAFAAAETVDLLGQQTQSTLDKIEAAKEGIRLTEEAVAKGEITPEQGAEKLREYRNELIDLNADLLEFRRTVQEELTEAFEAWNEKIEEGTSKIEFYGSVLSGFKNIIDLVGKDMLGLTDKTIKNLNGAIVSNANDAIKATKSQLDANKATLERMKQAREEARARGDEEAVLDWDKQIKIAEEKVQELTTTLQEDLSTGLEASISSFQDTVDQIVEGFSEAVSGIYDSIEEMREAWDRQGEVAERYLNTYQQTYEINKLNRQIQNSIDKTDNVGSQRELRALQQEMLEMTKDGQQLSKYDLEYLQKKYDLLVAEQALKDAQNAKSVVTLRRDSEGNYGYVYTADQNAIDNATQNYEDKLYSYQNFSLEMDKAMTEAYISANEKYLENMAWVNENFTKGSEEYEEHMERVNREYAEDLAWISDESEKLTTRNIQINQDFSAGVADTYSKTYLGQILPNYQSFEQLYTETTGLCEQATGKLNQAMIDLRNKIDEQLELAGYDADDFEQDINEEFGDVQQDSKDTADEVENMAKDMDTALNGPDGAISKVEDFQKAYYDEMEKVWNETGKIINKVKELITEYGKLAEAAGKDYTPETKPPETTSGGGNQGTNGNGGSNNSGDSNETDTSRNNNIYLGESRTKYGDQVMVLGWDEAGYIKGSDGNKYLVEETSFETWDNVKNRYWFDVKNTKRISNRANAGEIVSSNGKTYFLANDGLLYDVTGKTSHTNGSNIEYVVDEDIKGIKFPYRVGRKASQWIQIYTDKTQPGQVAGTTKEIKSGSAITEIDIANNKVKIPVDTRSVSLSGTGGSNTRGSASVTTKEEWVSVDKLKGFNTGGYTGSWGPEGRLAMLHQKEIVLNAHDTENFLTAIGIVRDISDQLEKNALAMGYQNAFAHCAAGIQTSDNIFQQEVHITAEFPNATNHNEIEEAFRNLTNLASQYVNRKF